MIELIASFICGISVGAGITLLVWDYLEKKGGKKLWKIKSSK